MLVKLTPVGTVSFSPSRIHCACCGTKFSNDSIIFEDFRSWLYVKMLHNAFTCTDTKSAKNTDNLTVFLCFWYLHAYKLLAEHL